jgi:hypothetical protein
MGAEKRILDGFERVLSIPEDPERVSERAMLVLLDQEAKRVTVTGQAPRDGNCVIHSC